MEFTRKQTQYIESRILGNCWKFYDDNGKHVATVWDQRLADYLTHNDFPTREQMDQVMSECRFFGEIPIN